MAAPKIAGSQITAVVADQYSVCRAGVRAVLNGTAKVIAEADNGHDAVKLIRKLRPTVAVIGYWLPLLNGMGVAATITSSPIDTTRIILHTTNDLDATIEMAMRLRVPGYITKQTPVEKLAECVATVAGGHTWFDGTVQKHLQRYAHLNGYAHVKLDPLTDMEMEVIQLIAQGFNTREIARKLGPAEKTIDRHRQNIYLKLNVNDVAGVTRYAIRAGYVQAHWSRNEESDKVKVAA